VKSYSVLPPPKVSLLSENHHLKHFPHTRC
jgi:hypothetical protein